MRATTKPREEWIAVPVPDSGIPREVVDAAREAIADNKPVSNNGERSWELSGGVLRCSACGLAMRTNITRKGTKRYCYYLCRKHHTDWEACPNRKNYLADKIEPQVWELISGIMKDPEQLRDDLERMVELERDGLRGDPDREIEAWLDKLAEISRMRGGYQEMAAKGLMTFEELGERLRELEQARNTAESELETLRSQRERIMEIERDKEALLESYAGMASDAFDSLSPQERSQIYKMLRLRVLVDEDGRIEATGAFGASPEVCTLGSSPWRR